MGRTSKDATVRKTNNKTSKGTAARGAILEAVTAITAGLDDEDGVIVITHNHDHARGQVVINVTHSKDKRR